MTNTLDIVASSLISYRNVLTECGMDACMVDEKWMAENCSPAERLDLSEYLASLATEAVHSRSPAEIIYSDPGGYEWSTRFIAERVTERFNKFGSVNELFANSETRHLAELTIATQRLSMMLERGSPSARTMFQERNRMFDEARARELERTPYICERISVLGFGSSQEFHEVRRVKCSDGILQLNIDGSQQSSFGSVFGSMHYSKIGETAGRRVYFHVGLPMQYDVYSRFVSDAEAALCLTAWRLYFDEVCRCLTAAGLVVDRSPA